MSDRRPPAIALVDILQAVALCFHIGFGSGLREEFDDLFAGRDEASAESEVGVVRQAAEWMVKEAARARLSPRWHELREQVATIAPELIKEDRFSTFALGCVAHAQAQARPPEGPVTLFDSGQYLPVLEPLLAQFRLRPDMSDPIVSPRLFVAPDLFEAFVERLSTELIPLLPPYDLWEAGAAAPPDPVSAPRAEAVLTGVGEILNAGLEFGSPLCYFWRDLLGHMKPDWWRERDGMIAAGVPRMSPSDDVIGFLDAFLNRLLDFLRIFGERVGERPYRSRYAIEAAAVPIVDAASAQLDVSEESDGMWVLEGPFDQFVVLFEWATGELLVSPELVRAGSSVPQ